jgi:predicted SnoaL-like aldol condensation-catalyzing enzyme
VTFLKAFLEGAESYMESVKEGSVTKGSDSRRYIADNCVVHNTGRSHMGGWHKGPAFGKFVTDMAQYKMTIVEVIDVLASDHRVCGLYRERFDADDGRFIDFVRLAIYRIADGQIVEVLIRDDDPYAMDEFYLGGTVPPRKPWLRPVAKPPQPQALIREQFQSYVDEASAYIAALKKGTARVGEYRNSYMDNEIVVHYSGRSDIGGFHPPGTFFSRFAPRLGQYKTTIVDIVDLMTSDDRVVAIVKEHLEADDGRSIDTERINMYRFAEGKIVEMWVRDDDQHAMDAFLMHK